MSQPVVETASRVGEVVESATDRCTVQCYQLYQAPPLGTLVMTRSPAVYGVVSRISTESLYPGRPVVARGEDEETEEGIYRANPQLTRLLCTRFEATILGYAENGTVRHGLPPLPPPVHAFAHRCIDDEVRKFTQSLDFLALLLEGQPMWADEIASAMLVKAADARTDRGSFLLTAGKALAARLASDLPRLDRILRRISSR